MTHSLDRCPGVASGSSVLPMLDWLDTVQLVALKANYDGTKWELLIGGKFIGRNGYLHGEWIDADQDSEEIMADIKAMLSQSPMNEIEECEEWAIHSYEGFLGVEISEYESIDRVVELAQSLAEHGEAMAAYLEHYSFEDIDGFEDRYQGCYKNKQDFAEEQYEQNGMIQQIEAAGLKACYIEFEMIARDMFIDGYTGINCGYETFYVFCDY